MEEREAPRRKTVTLGRRIQLLSAYAAARARRYILRHVRAGEIDMQAVGGRSDPAQPWRDRFLNPVVSRDSR
jgi:hypothetical protein